MYIASVILLGNSQHASLLLEWDITGKCFVSIWVIRSSNKKKRETKDDEFFANIDALEQLKRLQRGGGEGGVFQGWSKMDLNGWNM